MKTASPLSYFGSDAAVADRIGAYFDSCNHVTIPFCGGMSILPHLKAKGVVANDLNEHAVHFYSTLSSSDFRDELVAMCNHTLSHPTHLQQAASQLDGDTVSRAWAYWAMCWLNRGGQGGTTNFATNWVSFRMSASGGNNASRLKAVCEDLNCWAAEFKRCEWTCMDYKKLLEKVHWNKPKCGVYLDPPWFEEGGAYQHKFSNQDHRELSQCLYRGLFDKRDVDPARILIRYGDNPWIRELYDIGPMWHITEIQTRNQGNNKVQEIWITNYSVES